MTQTDVQSAEETFRIPGPNGGLSLFLRFARASRKAALSRGAVMYVHGATFPSALSVAYRFNGRSWRDALCDAGFDVWALDFQGFGGSDRYAEFDDEAGRHAPLCACEDAARQLHTAVKFALSHQGSERLSLISHSWGSMPAGRLASEHPALVDRWVLFGPIAQRPPRRYETPPSMPGWRLVSLEDQWARFVEDVPDGAAPVLSRREFERWGEAYLDTDRDSRTRQPPSVKTPLGPFNDILRAWHGRLPYDPGEVQAPIAIIRGEWDGLLPDDEARWLFNAFTASPIKRDVKISRATHLMHLEMMRAALWKESVAFLTGDDVQ